MASSQGIRRRRAAVVAAGLLVAVLALFAGSAGAMEAQRKRAPSSPESSLPKQYRGEEPRPEASRLFRISRERVIKLKTSSFWNKRPYQFATPLVADERLYVGVDAGFVYAIGLDRGDRLWTFKAEGPIHSKPALSGDDLFIGDAKGIVYDLGAEKGEKRWSTALDSEILATPLPLGTTLYVTTMSGRLYALDASTGSERWHTDADEKEFGFSLRRAASPVAAGGFLILGTSGGFVKAVHASNGSVAWSKRLGDGRSQVYDVDSTPVASGGVLYAASADGTVASLSLQSGSVGWSTKAGGVGDLFLHEGRLYATGGGALYALDPGGGSIVWQHAFKAPELSSPAAADGFVAVVSTTDKIHIVDAATGDLAYSYYVKKGSLGDPTIGGDRVYVLSNAARLYVFRVQRRE
jgi:outer membrane protein assembly factor BamB